METSQKLLPVYAEDRINYLLKLFLINNDYLKTDDVAEELLISKTTISNDLKEVRERLSYFHLELVSKPSYGMKLIGKEIHRRSCIAQYFFHTETVDDRYFHMESMNETQKKIRDILFEVLNEKQFRLTDIGFQNLIIHISIAIMRNRESTEVDIKDYREIENKKEFDIANLLVSKIEKAFSVRLKQQETYYIAIHLLGKKAIRYNNGYTITNEVEKIMQDIFKEINKNYDIDFSKDFELYTLLALHIQPMMDRLRYGLKVANPLLNEVKEKNSEAFEIAVFTANVIDKSTGFVLDEAEIGYLALHFALAIERIHKENKPKKSIIIVCASGMGSSQILLYKIKTRFNEYINKVLVTELYKLDSQSLSEYDIILSTVPIPFSTPIPVIEVQYFLDGVDIRNVGDVLLKNESLNFIDKYFDDKLFFSDLKGTTKEEVIHEMVVKTALIRKLPHNFEKMVLDREYYSATEFGNMIAMPHPVRPISDETFATVGVLNKPIRWKKKLIKYVFMLSVKKDSTENLALFYEVISFLVRDKKTLKKFENNLTMSNLKTILSEVANKSKGNDIDDIFV